MQIDLININPTALYLLWVLEDAGYEARICGGAVRDIISNKTPKDWDIATTALPEQVMSALDVMGIITVPTGLKHGTVTAVKDSIGYEITTLRTDVATDGRHADVAFTDDWKLDAARRDFTMNAMYLDSDGTLYDYHNGQRDLSENIIKFVGDADTRIKEDYLRIMRYFRFMVTSGTSEASDYTRRVNNIIANNAKGLGGISGERIWSELKKILVGQTPVAVLNMMQHNKVLENIGLGDLDSTAATIAAGWPTSQEPAVRLLYIYTVHAEDSLLPANKDIDNLLDLLYNKFHASAKEISTIKFIRRYNHLDRIEHNIRRLLAFNDINYVMAWVSVSNSWPIIQVRWYDTLKFPITGKDLLSIGMESGPIIGKTLVELRNMWADSNFDMTHDQLLDRAKGLI